MSLARLVSVGASVHAPAAGGASSRHASRPSISRTTVVASDANARTSPGFANASSTVLPPAFAVTWPLRALNTFTVPPAISPTSPPPAPDTFPSPLNAMTSVGTEYDFPLSIETGIIRHSSVGTASEANQL